MAVRHGSPASRNDDKNGDKGFVEQRRGSVRLLLNDFAREVIAAQGGNVSFEEVIAATGSPEQCVEKIRGQLDLGCDGVILHGASPTELAPVVDAYRKRRPAGRFDSLAANPAASSTG